MHWLSAVHWASPDSHYVTVPIRDDAHTTTNTTTPSPFHTVYQTTTTDSLDRPHSRTWLWWAVWVCVLITIFAVVDSCYLQGSSLWMVCVVTMFLVCTCGGNMFYPLHGSWPWAILFSGLVVWVAALSGISSGRYYNILDRDTCRYVPPSFY